jgi:hypothetical protein
MISFDLVKKQVSDLFIAFENIQMEAQQILDNARDADIHRKEANERLDTREKEAKAESKRLEEERAYLVDVRLKQKAKELQLADFDKKKKESELLVDGANKKIAEATETVKKLFAVSDDNKKYDEQIKQRIEDLKQKENRISQRENLISKSEEIDKQRKEILDAREKRIQQTEERLQRVI